MTATTFVRPLPPSGSSETSPHLLEHLAHCMGLTIDMPPPTGGWARIETRTGSKYHAWLPAAVGVEATS